MSMPPRLPDDVLAKRQTLPLKPDAVVLEGQFVRLVPTDLDRDTDTLYAISNGSPIVRGHQHFEAYDADALIWRWMFAGPFADVHAMREYMRGQVESKVGLAFTVFDRATDQAVGVANYLANSPQDLKIELGSIWYSPLAQRTNANLETTHLLLKHAFALGYRRLEWKCNTLNERSKKSALRMGFTFEGIQEGHYIIKDRNRDTAWFRILAHEWDAVRAHQEQLLAISHA